MKKKNVIIYFLLILLLLIFFIWLYRFFSSRQIDDVSPMIDCDGKFLNKSNTLFVIPKFKNISIADNMSWCKYILSLNKTIAMHGVYHTYREFDVNISEEYFDEGTEIFYECFGFYPTEFKAPQMKINLGNKEIILKKEININSWPSWFFHKVYHCNEEGEYAIHIVNKIVLKNRFIDFI